MIQFEAKTEDIQNWFPETYKIFLEELRNSKSIYSQEEKLEWIITWGFYRTKGKTEEEKIAKDDEYMEKLKLPYEDRVIVDLSKIKIDISLKAGKYVRSDRSFDITPKYIIDMAYEVLKVTMIKEQFYLNDPVVLKSLETFQELIDSVKEMMEEATQMFEAQLDVLTPKRKSVVSYDMDDILDKISEKGISSLSPGELQFLEKMSKNS